VSFCADRAFADTTVRLSEVQDIDVDPSPRRPVLPFTALRAAFRDGYSLRQLRADATAGAIVGIVALPLSMALAIATGVPPQHGLYTAIVGGALIALLGGSRCQVSGPTAAFVAILLPIVQQHGLGGLMVASMLAGLLLVLLGLFRLGRFIQFVPYPVVTGFTAGIAVTIATGQLANFTGMQGVKVQSHWHQVIGELVRCAHTVSGFDVAIGAGTLLLLVVVPKLLPKVPAPLVAIGIATLVGHLLAAAGVADVVTIAKKFVFTAADGTHAGIPPWPPVFQLPWLANGADGLPLDLDYEHFKPLLLAAVTICMLGAIESLLSAVVADGMTGTRHDPDAELLAQGIGNLVAPFFGGFAATGAIARTATNIRAGAKSPFAAVVHAAFLLAAILALAPVLGEMPMAALAALLLMVAWRMADLPHVVHVVRTAPGPDVLVFAACCLLTVAFDMVVGVVAGMMLASVLFLRRLAGLTGVRLVRSEHPELGMPIPPGVLVYEIEGPLFFGAAERAMNALHSIGQRGVVVVLDLDGVQTIDATGLVTFESALSRLRHDHVRVVLTGVQEHVAEILERAHITADDVQLFRRPTLRDGVTFAASLPSPSPHARSPQPSTP
jgi:SulP family sulfate permease